MENERLRVETTNLENQLQEAQMEIERLRELLNAKDIKTTDLGNQLQEAKKINKALEKTFWATDAENHVSLRPRKKIDLIVENHTLKADKEDVVAEKYALKPR